MTTSSAWNSRRWPWTAESPRHRRRRGEGRKKPGGQGQTGHRALDGGGRFGHPAWRRECPGQSSHDSPLLVPTLEAASEALGALPEGTSVHLENAATTRVSPASVWRSWG